MFWAHLKLPNVASGCSGVESVELPAVLVPLNAVNLEMIELMSDKLMIIRNIVKNVCQVRLLDF